MGRATPVARALALLALAGLALVLSGCEVFSSPQNTFNPSGEVASDQKDYFLWVMWPALVIGVGVMGACLFLPIAFRSKKGDTTLPKQTHGNTPLELTWTIIPALVMAVVGGVTVVGIIDLGREPDEDALKVNVIGARYLWDFQYPDLLDAGGQPIVGPVDDSGVPEMRIPVDREIGVYVIGADVIHSFWIPKLAGKIDAVPNHENRIWLKASETGEYVGQCAEFCGLDHSLMRLKVIVLEQGDFDAWVAEQQARGADDIGGVDDGHAVSGGE